MWERGAPTIMIKLLQADHGFFGRARIQWERRYEYPAAHCFPLRFVCGGRTCVVMWGEFTASTSIHHSISRKRGPKRLPQWASTIHCHRPLHDSARYSHADDCELGHLFPPSRAHQRSNGHQHRSRPMRKRSGRHVYGLGKRPLIFVRRL